MRKTTVFFDMDGVLTDFVRGAFAFHGKSVPMADVRWDFPQQIGFAGTWVAEFWGGLGHDFWANLAPLADGFGLLKRAEELVGAENIGILSSPCDTKGCAEGKREWVAKHLPEYRKRLFLGSAKELFAGPTKLLVDDHDPNCDKFRSAGGHSLLVPRPWNDARDRSDAAGAFDVAHLTECLAETLDGMQLKKAA